MILPNLSRSGMKINKFGDIGGQYIKKFNGEKFSKWNLKTVNTSQIAAINFLNCLGKKGEIDEYVDVLSTN